jgi:transcriptional regulator with XRE-family HTH domain
MTAPPTRTREVIGRRLRVEREQQGLTLRELGRRTGVSASTICQLEQGKSWTTLETLCRLSTELRLSLDMVLLGVRLHSTDGAPYDS